MDNIQLLNLFLEVDLIQLLCLLKEVNWIQLLLFNFLNQRCGVNQLSFLFCWHCFILGSWRFRLFLFLIIQMSRKSHFRHHYPSCSNVVSFKVEEVPSSPVVFNFMMVVEPTSSLFCFKSVDYFQLTLVQKETSSTASCLL